MSEEKTNETVTNHIAADNSGGQKMSGGKKWGIIGGAAVVLIALIVGIGIYNTPAKRVARLLDLGYRYLEEENYEQAALTFDKAIAIVDRCIDAYAGGIKSYQGLGDKRGLVDIYERALDAAAGLEESELAESMDTVVEIYLLADDVYSDNPEKMVQALEDGLELTGDDRIKDRLIEDYLDLAKDYTDEDSFEKAMEIYDRLLELDAENDNVQSDAGKCLDEYLELLIEQSRFDEARALIEKYRDKIHTVDFQAYFDRIAELERVMAENNAFMQKVYDLMAAEDYEAMHGVDGSEEAAAFVERMDGDSYIYVPGESSSRTGTGAGVYIFGRGGYYFYYGSLADGSREGTGVSFCNNSDGGYDVFTGQWQNDAPNGEGELRISYGIAVISGDGYSSVWRGNLVNGLWDGPIDYKAYSNETYDLSFTAVNGVPQEDVTEEFYDSLGFQLLEEDERIFAFDNQNGQWGWHSWHSGERFGVDGFTD